MVWLPGRESRRFAPAVASCASSLRRRRCAVKTQLMQSGGRDLPIIEGNRTAAQDLYLLMALARDQHDVSLAGFAKRNMNRLPPVRFGLESCSRTLQSHQRIIDDGQRIFTPRIIGSYHHEVAALPRSLAH